MDKNSLSEQLKNLEDRLDKNVERQKELSGDTSAGNTQPEKEIDPKLREIHNLEEVKSDIEFYTERLDSENDWEKDRAEQVLKAINNSPLEYYANQLSFYSKENYPEDHYRSTEESYRKIVDKINAINEGRQIEEDEELGPEEIIIPQRELTPQEVQLENNLNEARQRYTEAYKAAMADNKNNSSLWKRGLESVFGKELKDDEIPQELKALEQEYDAAAIALGNEMTANGSSRTEIFKRVVIDEQEEIGRLKVENLPPKEKGVFKKGLDWYLKQKWYTKMAISLPLSIGGGVALTFVAMPGVAAAAGGMGAYTTMRAIRAVSGAGTGKIASGGLSFLWKDRSGETREESEKELEKLFEINSLSEAKKEYAKIIEQEQKSKRRRGLAIAGAGILAGGITNIGVGHYGAGSLLQTTPGGPTGNVLNPDHTFKPGTTSSPTETPTARATPSQSATSPKITTDGAPKAPSVSQQAPSFINEGITIKDGHGGIRAISDLQNQIKAQYPDISKAPQSVQYFVKADPTTEAVKLGFYDPDPSHANESALIQEGSVLKFDDKGNLLFGQPDADGNIAPLGEKYTGKMFDSDGRAKVIEHQTIRKVTHNPAHKVDSIKIPKPHGAVIEQDIKIDASTPKNILPNEITIKERTFTTGGEPIQTGQSMTTGQDAHTGETVLSTGKTIKTGGETILTNETINAKPSASPTPEQVGTSTTPKPSPTPEEIAKQKVLDKYESKVSIAERHPELRGTPFSKNTYGLPEEKLVETAKVYQKNIEYISQGENNSSKWLYVKQAPATNFIGAEAVEGDRIVPYLNKLQQVTGVRPIAATALLNRAETIEEYITRALQKAAEMQVLDKVKY